MVFNYPSQLEGHLPIPPVSLPAGCCFAGDSPNLGADPLAGYARAGGALELVALPAAPAYCTRAATAYEGVEKGEGGAAAAWRWRARACLELELSNGGSYVHDKLLLSAESRVVGALHVGVKRVLMNEERERVLDDFAASASRQELGKPCFGFRP